jgi:glycosyltransferase involved in cell wall biosynthesis
MADLSPPDVTVVTPSYNQGAFIEETILSVLNQTGATIEYMVMDGGSTDRTVEILEKYRDRLEFVSEKDKGQTDAINKGLRRSRGRILAYLNSDDTYLAGAVAKAMRFLDSHSEFAMVYGEGYHVDVQGRFLERYYTEPFDFCRLAEICFICQPTVFFRRELLSTIGFFDASLHYCMDYDYWIRVGKRYAIGYIPEYLATSKLHLEGKTLAKTVRFHQEILNTVQRHYGHVPSRWVAAYAHRYLERFLSRKGRIRELAFRVLVHAIFLMKYVALNKRLPLNDSMKRLQREEPWEENPAEGSEPIVSQIR